MFNKVLNYLLRFDSIRKLVRSYKYNYTDTPTTLDKLVLLKELLQLSDEENQVSYVAAYNSGIEDIFLFLQSLIKDLRNETNLTDSFQTFRRIKIKTKNDYVGLNEIQPTQLSTRKIRLIEVLDSLSKEVAIKQEKLGVSILRTRDTDFDKLFKTVEQIWLIK